MATGYIYTFYSFKGGVGRSFLLANVGTLLATWGYDVLLVDWDLEAPGLAHYFADFLPKASVNEIEVPYVKQGLLELIEDRAAAGPSPASSPDWGDYVNDIDLKRPSGRLSLMAAGGTRGDYVSRVQKLKWVELYEKQGIGRFLEHLRGSWKSVYDFVLIDSRTGVTDSGGICSVHMPDVLVLVFAPNFQNLNGIIEISHRSMAAHAALPFTRVPLDLLPIPSRMESFMEVDLDKEWSERIAKKVQYMYENWKHIDLSPGELIEKTKIPYIGKWSFGEKLPVLEESGSDPVSITSFIVRIAALIARRLADSKDFVKDPYRFIEKAKLIGREKQLGTDNREYDIYLSAPPDQSSFATQLVSALRRDYGRSVAVHEDVPSISDSPEAEADTDAVASTIRKARHFVAVIGQEFGDRQGTEMVEALKQMVDKLLIEREAPGRIIFIEREIPQETIQYLRTYFPKCQSISTSDKDVAEVARAVVESFGDGGDSGQGDVPLYARISRT